MRLAAAIGQAAKKLESATAALKKHREVESGRRLRREARRIKKRKRLWQARIELNHVERYIGSEGGSDDSLPDN